MTLTEFLLARIAEDEHWWRVVEERENGVDVPVTNWLGSRMTTRMLAECEAKRQIVHEFVTFSQVADERADGTPLPQALTTAGIVKGLERTLGHLATPYADHPDYDATWRP